MGMPTSLMSPAAIRETFGGRVDEFLPAPFEPEGSFEVLSITLSGDEYDVAVSPDLKLPAHVEIE